MSNPKDVVKQVRKYTRRVEKIKGVEKRKRKNSFGRKNAFLLGDFDVFASCFSSSPRA